jgi:hypothetical protein
MLNTDFITADLLRATNNTDTKMDLMVLSPQTQHIFIIIYRDWAFWPIPGLMYILQISVSNDKCLHFLHPEYLQLINFIRCQ